MKQFVCCLLSTRIRKKTLFARKQRVDKKMNNTFFFLPRLRSVKRSRVEESQIIYKLKLNRTADNAIYVIGIFYLYRFDTFHLRNLCWVHQSFAGGKHHVSFTFSLSNRLDF